MSTGLWTQRRGRRAHETFVRVLYTPGAHPATDSRPVKVLVVFELDPDPFRVWGDKIDHVGEQAHKNHPEQFRDGGGDTRHGQQSEFEVRLPKWLPLDHATIVQCGEPEGLKPTEDEHHPVIVGHLDDWDEACGWSRCSEPSTYR